MAQRISVHLVDDIDGSDAAETVQFGVDGVSYEIDLSGPNAAALRESLAGCTERGRRLGRAPKSSRRGSRRGATTSATSAAGREQSKHIREWARKKGYELSDRGRIPAQVMQDYLSVHSQ